MDPLILFVLIIGPLTLLLWAMAIVAEVLAPHLYPTPAPARTDHPAFQSLVAERRHLEVVR